MCTRLCVNLVPDPVHAIPCHARIESRSAPTTQDLNTHPSALMMVIVLVVMVVPAPSLLQTGCSAAWGGVPLALPGGCPTLATALRHQKFRSRRPRAWWPPESDKYDLQYIFRPS